MPECPGFDDLPQNSSMRSFTNRNVGCSMMLYHEERQKPECLHKTCWNKLKTSTSNKLVSPLHHPCSQNIIAKRFVIFHSALFTCAGKHVNVKSVPYEHKFVMQLWTEMYI